MNKTRIAITVGTAFLLSVASMSYAADTATKQPMDQAVKSVDKNLAKDPDNKGLQNAAGRLQTNQERHEKKRAEKEARRKAKIERKEARHQAKINQRAEKMERPEKAERPEKMERPNR